jgi:hypothetical protein
MGIGPTVNGYLVQCGIVQSTRLVAMESLLVASVETFTEKNQNGDSLWLPSWILAKSENKNS